MSSVNSEDSSSFQAVAIKTKKQVFIQLDNEDEDENIEE